MEFKKHGIRCWETGVELPFSRAYGLDLQLALREYERLAAQVYYLDRLLSELGQPAGNHPRAKELGLPKYVRRVVSEVMANAHGAVVGIPDLFRPLPELIAARRKKWLDRLSNVPELGAYVRGLEEAARRRFANLAAEIRKRFDRAIYKEAVAIHLDAHLAMLYMDTQGATLELWLAELDLKEILACLEVPEDSVERLLDGIHTNDMDAAQQKEDDHEDADSAEIRQ